MQDPTDMTADQLEEYVSKLKEDLEEVEEERMFVLSQTGLHVSAKTVTKYESDINRLKEGIEEAERALRARQAG
jgi:transcription initiation factor IIE alpha subunit